MNHKQALDLHGTQVPATQLYTSEYASWFCRDCWKDQLMTLCGIKIGSERLCNKHYLEESSDVPQKAKRTMKT